MAVTRSDQRFGRSALLLWSTLLATAVVPAVLRAGQIYGTIVTPGGALARATVEINCGGAVTRDATASDGAYRINVPQQGQCSFALPDFAGRPSAVVFSAPNPSAYNFELVRLQNGTFQLRRR